MGLAERSCWDGFETGDRLKVSKYHGTQPAITVCGRRPQPSLLLLHLYRGHRLPTPGISPHTQSDTDDHRRGEALKRRERQGAEKD